MKILWVKAGKLLPIDTGGKIRSYNLLRHLARQHGLTLLSYYGGRRDPAYEEALAKEFPGAMPMATGAPQGAAGTALDYLWRTLSPAPYAVTKFTSARVQRQLAAWYRERRFDVAVCDFLAASLNFPGELPIPTALFQHNVESILWQRQARFEPNWVKRQVFRLEAAKMQRYEAAAVRRFHHVIAVSENDRELMARMTEPARISVVPTGVDVERFRAAAGPSAGKPLVVFTGSMDWEANIDAMEFFCGEVWPRVRARVPAAHFRIVGRDPAPRVRKLAGESVEVTGTVPSVIEHLREAAVVVVPLRIGGGTRLKIYEAMAMGKAVVSTTVGAEGLDVTHGRDIVLADDAESFAAAILRLLEDPAERRRYEPAAAALAARYDWSTVTELFLEALQAAQREARNAASAPAMAGVRP